MAGDSAQARQLADNLAENFPQDTIVQFNYLRTIRAAAAISSGSAAKAIESLTAAVPYDLATPANQSLNFNLYSLCLRGLAFLASGQGPAQASSRRSSTILARR